MSDSDEKVSSVKSENTGDKLFFSMVKEEKRCDSVDGKTAGDTEDSESLEEQPLDIGEHYLVRRSDDSWRKYTKHGVPGRYLNDAELHHAFDLLIQICAMSACRSRRDYSSPIQ